MQGSSSHIDESILAHLAAGERKATEQLYNQHYPIITKWIQHNGGSEPDADDIYQEAMVVLYEKAQDETFRLSCKIGTYLFAISKHLWYKKVNKQQASATILTDEEQQDWAYEDDIKAHEEREGYYNQLNAALAQIGEPCQSLLKAFYHDDKSMQEIASGFGYTNTDNAKTQKYKCLARLRKLFYVTQVK